MSRVFPNSSLKRCNQPRPIGFKLLDEDMWNSDRVLITSSPFKHWAKWRAICSCFAWNSSAYEGLKHFAFHHMEQCRETDHTILKYKCWYPSNKQTDIWKQCSAQWRGQTGLPGYYFRKDRYFKRCVKCIWGCAKVPTTFQLKLMQKILSSPL